MFPENQINDLVKRLRDSAGENLISVVLYGSAAAGEFHRDFSNLNLLCALRESSFAALSALAPAIAWWIQQKYSAPLVLTREELERSADVFAIEFLDMKQHHRVLYGEDVLQNLRVPMHLHRAQVEYELRVKLILLRQQLLSAGADEARLWELLIRSLPSFTTLFGHALIAMGETAPADKREALSRIGTKLSADTSAFAQLLDIREHKAERRQFDVKDVFLRYLAAVQQVTAAVDTMWSSSGAGNS